MAENKSNLKSSYWLIGVIGALLLMNGYLMFNKISHKDKIDREVSRCDTIEIERKKLRQEHEEIVVQLEKMQESNLNSNKMIADQEEEIGRRKQIIEQLLKKIETGEVSAAELEYAKKEIETLKKLRDQYLSSILLLRKEHQTAIEGAHQSEFVANQLRDTIVEVKSQVVKANLDRQRMVEENYVYKNQLDRASALLVKSVTIKTIKTKKNNKERVTDIAKVVDKLNICFDVEANKVASPGEDTIKVRILAPSGVTLKAEGFSGVVYNKDTYQNVNFTTSTAFRYDMSTRNMCVAWVQNKAFEPGNYFLEFYNKGYLVGRSAFQLY